MISLLDYGAGNVRSVINALEKLGETVKIVTSGDEISNAERLVFPGVGSFGSMIQILQEKKYFDPWDCHCLPGVCSPAVWRVLQER